MTNIENDLEQMFRRRELDLADVVPATTGIVRRTRRRQLLTVGLSLLVAAAVITIPVAGAHLFADSPAPRPASEQQLPSAPEGWRGVVLPEVSLVYPTDWFLLVGNPAKDNGAVFQLSNFDPGDRWYSADASGMSSLAPRAVVLRITTATQPASNETWPVTVATTPAAPSPAASIIGRSWTTSSGAGFAADGVIGREASQADVRVLETSFASMNFELDNTMSTPVETPVLVLDTIDSTLGPLTLYASTDVEGPWVGVLGPKPGFGAASIGSNPRGDEDVTMSLGADAGVVWGDVSTGAKRAVLRTVEGEDYPARLVPFPDSLGTHGVQAVWGTIDSPTEDRVTTLLYDADGNVLNQTYPTGPDVTIAEGTHPVGGPWRLFITTSNDGAGLSFAFEEHGGGGGCCMRPLGDNDLYQLGFSSSSDRSIPHDIEGLASTTVARVEYVHADGRVFEGALYPIPDRFIGPANALLIFVPGDVHIDGTVVASDGSGKVLQRKQLSTAVEERAGPTPEIDAVWTALRAARDAVSRYLSQAGTLVGVTPDAMDALAPDVTFNASASAVANEVSLRGATERDIALVSTTKDGDVYCIAVEATNGGGNYRYGRQDAATPDECGGGWE